MLIILLNFYVYVLNMIFTVTIFLIFLLIYDPSVIQNERGNLVIFGR